LAALLQEAGVAVTFQDPLATHFPHPVTRDLMAAVEGADALVIVADHPQYHALGMQLPALRDRMQPSPALIDTRGMVPDAPGFLLWRLGRGFMTDHSRH
jgi:UDP-N-acetyl-D-mannosaminuronate dehydrogenase